jgi:putative transposase
LRPRALSCRSAPPLRAGSLRLLAYLLTITDLATRCLLVCEALSSTQSRFAFTVFERAFKEFGMPAVIRTDNGSPFAGPTALYRLSKLSVCGCAWGFGFNASSRGIHNKTAGTSACT